MLLYSIVALLHVAVNNINIENITLKRNNDSYVKGRKAGVYSALQLEEADCTLTH
jgi:hypothetical protein